MQAVRTSTFEAPADADSFDLIGGLRDGAKSLQELSEALDLPRADIAEHMLILRECGVVNIWAEGNKAYCCLAGAAIV
jgi:DNA-binding IclR family transcriptional regulator